MIDEASAVAVLNPGEEFIFIGCLNNVVGDAAFVSMFYDGKEFEIETDEQWFKEQGVAPGDRFVVFRKAGEMRARTAPTVFNNGK